MIKYPDDYNPIEEYWRLMNSDKLLVCEKIYKTYKKVIADMEDSKSGYFYSHARANHVIEFIENFCRHSKGKLGGKPIILELWEKALLAVVFGFIDKHGLRKYREAVLIIGRKNGKSLLSSCVGLYMMVSDMEHGPEVYAVATKKDQAKIIWAEARSMVRKSASLKKRVKTLVTGMFSDFNDGSFRALASDSDTMDGHNAHCVLMDEIHQWKNGKALYDTMSDSTAAREQPLNFITSTAGTIRGDFYDLKYDEAKNIINGYSEKDGFKDDHFISFVYELDKRDEWQDLRFWIKPNPGLGTIKNREILESKVEKAKQNPYLIKNLLCKDFNWPETANEAWLSYDVAHNPATFDIEKLKPRYGIGGLDLSMTTDLTCATIIFKVRNNETIFVHQMYWLPADLLEKRVREDKIRYDLWLDAGWLRVSEGNKINYKDVVNWFKEEQEKHDLYVYRIGYDAWNSQYIVDELQANFGKISTVPIRQGAQTMSSPMKNFEADLAAKRINYNNNPITRWCLGNAAIKVDTNDNISLIKTSNPRKRIDGVSSLLDAYIVLENNADAYDSKI